MSDVGGFNRQQALVTIARLQRHSIGLRWQQLESLPSVQWAETGVGALRAVSIGRVSRAVGWLRLASQLRGLIWRRKVKAARRAERGPRRRPGRASRVLGLWRTFGLASGAWRVFNAWRGAPTHSPSS